MADPESLDAVPISRPSRADGSWSGFSRQAEKISGWCQHCGLHLFRESNQWIRLSQEYVFHGAGEETTSAIEESLKKVGDELTGSKELEKCRVVYLRCSKCNDRVGLHCNRGTRTQRYKHIALIRTKKIILKRAHDAEDLDFNIVGRIEAVSDEDDQPDGAAIAENNRQPPAVSKSMKPPQPPQPPQPAQSLQPPQPSPAAHLSGAIARLNVAAVESIESTPSTPVSTPTPASASAPVPPSALVSPATLTAFPSPEGTQMDSSEVCRTCKAKHMKCNRRHPVCRSCAHMGRQCIWPSNTILTTVKQESVSAPPSPHSVHLTPTEENVAAADCASCRMRHRACDKRLPKCSDCASANRHCKYQPKKVNAIDLLDPGPDMGSSTSSFQRQTADEAAGVSNGNIVKEEEEEVEEEEDGEGGIEADESGQAEDDAAGGDDDDDVNAMILTADESLVPNVTEPQSQAVVQRVNELESITNQVAEHGKVIEEQDAEIAKLNSTVLTQAGVIAELRLTVERLTGSMGKMEEWIERTKLERQKSLISDAQNAHESGNSYENSVKDVLSSKEGWRGPVAVLDDAPQTKAFNRPMGPSDGPLPSPRNGSERPAAVARRGGHAANGSFRRNLSSVLSTKRPLREEVTGSEPILHDASASPLADYPMAVDEPLPSGSRLPGASTRNSSASFHSLYDATPPPARPAPQLGNSIPVEADPQTFVGETQAVPATQSDGPDTSSRHLALVPTAEQGVAASRDDESDESETQAYLRRTVRQEDPDDDDYAPGDNTVEPYEWPAPGTQSVRNSLDRILTPAHPLPESPRRGTGRPRGRPPKHRLMSGPQREYEWVSQDSFVPSTPSLSNGPASAQGSAKRRGVGGVLKPVPNDLSHSAFSSSQAATMINDPTPKRTKIDDGSVSFATTPKHFGKTNNSRYPEGRVRDAEGYLLNKDGSRDLRSLRGRLLGRHAFTRGDGARRTVHAILHEKTGGAMPSRSPLAQSAAPMTPANAYAPTAGGGTSPRFYDPTISTPPRTQHAYGFSPINSPHRTINIAPASARTNAPAAQRTAATPTVMTDVGDRAAMAGAERVAKQYEKGNSKEYSAKHMAIMSKMKL